MIKCGRPCKGEEQQSKDRLLDAALHLFLAHGYGEVNLETIAKAGHVSLRTLYHHFDGKAGIFGALIRRCSDQFFESLPEYADPELALLTFAKEFLARMTQPDIIRIRAILIGESARFPDLAHQFYEHGPQRTKDYLIELFIKQQTAHKIKAIAPDFLADQFLSVLRGERMYRLQLGLETTPEPTAIEQWAEQATQLFLHGCLLPEQLST